MKTYKIETQFLEDVSGERHYKFKGGRDLWVENVKGEAEAIAAASYWLQKYGNYTEVLLPHTAKLVPEGEERGEFDHPINARRLWSQFNGG